MECKRFPLGPLWTNGFLVWDRDKKAFFVDPGGDADEVISFLNDEGISLEMILLTHGHSDHIGGLHSFSTLVNSVYVHEEDRPLLEDPDRNLSTFLGTPLSCSLPVQTFKDGDVFKVGQMEIAVLHTPGHTRGSCCFHVTDGDDEILLSGDTLFASSIGRTDLPGGDYDTLMRSITKLKSFPDDIRVLPGHGPETTLGREKTVNPYWPR
jgi:glyoxylase-like metal-dependent hydrolase (beta-lactamase superfamily II)